MEQAEFLQLQKAEIYLTAKTDFEFFAWHFFEHLMKVETPEFHREVYRLVRECTRLGIAAPRSFAKSTTISFIYAIHSVIYGDKEDVLIISNSGSLAEEWVRKIKVELESNPRILEIYGDLRLNNRGEEVRWTQDHIILGNGNQLRGKGRGYQIRGFRPTVVICDDLEDDEMVRSKDQRDKLKDWFLGALLNTLEPNQKLIYIGTLLHPLSLLKQIVLHEDPIFDLWDTRLYKAIQDTDGLRTSLWPQKWPLDKLEARKAEIGPHKFEAEFQNNPMADNSVVFHPDTYKYYEAMPDATGDPEFDVIQTVTGFDLIASEKDFAGKDYVAFVTLSKLRNGRVYTRDARRGRWTQDEICDAFCAIDDAFKPDAFVGENNAFQQIIQGYLIKKLRDEKKKVLNIQGIRLGSYTDADPTRKAKDKVSRALTVQHVFTQGLFYVMRAMREFIEELMTFPAGDYDDQVDAMVHALHVLLERVKLQATASSAKHPGQTPASAILPDKRFNKRFYENKGIILEG